MLQNLSGIVNPRIIVPTTEHKPPLSKHRIFDIVNGVPPISVVVVSLNSNQDCSYKSIHSQT